MRFPDFRKALKNKFVFTTNDIKKIDPGFHRRRLVEWQKAGYILKIRNGYYCFSDRVKSEQFNLYLANQLYKPSYISLISAFAFYNLIPEAVFHVTSIATLKTATFKTDFGRFDYRNIKPSLFFGYKLEKTDHFIIKIAEPEKMILDYCYLIKPSAVPDFEALRINREELAQMIDIKKFDGYLSLYRSKIMNARANIFKTYLYA